MNTVRMGKTDIGRYFAVEDDVLDPHGRLRASKNKVTIRHQRTASQQGSGGASASAAAAAATTTVETNVSVPLRAMDDIVQGASPQWLSENLPKFFTLGLALADLLLIPLGGSEFVDYFYQLILEMDVAYATGSTARVLATRALKNHRALVPSYSDSMDGASAGGGQQDGSAAAAAAASGSSKLCIVSESHLHPPFVPSYDTVVPALCTTLVFAYRKMCDYDAVENEDVVKMIVLVDRRIKSLFFGAISKELGKLGQAKLLQQAALLSDSIFAAFSNADASLINELLKMRSESMAAAAVASSTAGKHADDDD
jgi:hypothetical protein